MTDPSQDIRANHAPGPSAADEKRRLRRQFLARRDHLTPASVRAFSGTVIERFWRLQKTRSLATQRQNGRSPWLSCYVAFGREVETRPLLQAALERGYRVTVPIVETGRDSKLILSEIHSVPGVEDPGPGWTRTAFGLYEPYPPAPVRPTLMDCFVLPGLAFDRRGTRLGFGKGYYDRLLASARPDVFRVALAFSCQIAERLPRDEWDIPVHRILTERETIRCHSFLHTSTPGGQSAHHRGGDKPCLDY